MTEGKNEKHTNDRHGKSAAFVCGTAFMIDVIEDDDAVRQSMQVLLETYGYRVRTHSSAEAFLGAPRPSDCLLVNQHMTGIRGTALIDHLRRSGDHTPAVIITACETARLFSDAERLSVRVLTKPVRCEELFAVIDQIVPVSPS